MKLLNLWYSLLCIFIIQIYSSILSMDVVNVSNESVKNKTHNAISSSVENNDSSNDNVDLSGSKKNDVLAHVDSSNSSNIINQDDDNLSDDKSKSDNSKDKNSDNKKGKDLSDKSNDIDSSDAKKDSDKDADADKSDSSDSNKKSSDNDKQSDDNKESDDVNKSDDNKDSDDNEIVSDDESENDKNDDVVQTPEEIAKQALFAHEAFVAKKKREEEKLSHRKINALYQDKEFVDENESIVFSFEDTDLLNVALYIEKKHHVKFLTEDIISPSKDAKGLAGHKINFRTNKVLTKRESWDLFITFLNIAQLDLVPMPQNGFYKIVAYTKANGEPVPTYIGIDPSVLPDNDMVIRYVYFVQNIDPAKIQNLLRQFQAGSAKLDVFAEMKALIFLDKSNNIKSLMQIAIEMDRSVLPQCLSVIKLKRANVADVVTLYQSLTPGGSNAAGTQPSKAWVMGKKEPSFSDIPQDVKMFPYIRTNALILLGNEKSIKKIENFIEKYIDQDLNRPTPPVFTYQLEYCDATSMVNDILSKVVTYGQGSGGSGGSGTTSTIQYGGVLNGVKYFSPMTIVPEPHSNSVVINSTKEDYEALLPLIKELDKPQKQIGLEVLIVQVTDSQVKILGSQISGPNGPDSFITANQQAQTFAKNITAQTSGIFNSGGQATSPVVVQNSSTSTTTPTSYSLKASLGALLGAVGNGTGVVNEPGSILVTFGQPIWALFKMLQSMVSLHVVANPFLVVSNNTAAQISIGEVRRILASQVVSVGGTTTSGLTSLPSTLGFTITPQINKSNIVNLSINVTNNQFTVAGSSTSALQDTKNISTNASVANGEVLVLGGLMQETYSSTSRGVPLLEHIPIFGWLFKSKTKTVDKSHFLVFICPRLIEEPDKKEQGIDAYTLYKMKEAQQNIDIMDEMDWFASKRDPLQRSFFGETMPKSLQGFEGQEVSVKTERKQRAKHKEKIHAASQKKDEQKKVNNKKSSGKGEDFNNLSFDKEFNNHVVPSSKYDAKNAISSSVLKGGANG